MSERSVLVRRCEALQEIRQLSETALNNYIKEKSIDTVGGIGSISNHPSFKKKFEGVETQIKFPKRGKCGIIEAVIPYWDEPDGSIGFNKKDIQIKEF